MELDFIRQRITELRLKKGVSEYKMSLDLGHSRSYIQHIVCGRSLPSIQELLYICDYLEVTPSDFFDDKLNNPALVQQAYGMLKDMEDDDLLALITIMNRIKNK